MKNSNNQNEKKITKKELNEVFIRSISYNGSFNYERQLNLGWAFSLMPVLRKLYGDDKEQMARALKRHLEFNNITPFICTILFGITTALEEENANDPDFDESSINAVKVGLMGPLSGIGDSIFFGTIRTLGAAIGCSLALEGSALGPILFFLIFNIPNFLSRYFLMGYGYKLGTSFLEKVEQSGIISKVFKGTAILGLMVIGGMVASTVKVPLALQIGSVNLLDTINGVFPKLLSLAVTLLIYQLLKKDMKATSILFWIIVLSIAGTAVGLF
ncbi:PTS system mannose-specific EIID component [bioreactor metagenome]|uniref:PTS system mannose-specific EIID component n=1 Tax=bioreactor metagenome TaxID=1076179 RepID=A0A645BQU7_9ZZZZ